MASQPIERAGTYTTGELGKLFRVSSRTIKRSAQDGTLPAYLVPGERPVHRFDHHVLLRHFLAKGEADTDAKWFIDCLNLADAKARDRELAEAR